MKQRRFVIFLMACLFIGSILTGCSDDESIVIPEEGIKATCEGCHTNEEMLKATALPDPPPDDEGEG